MKYVGTILATIVVIAVVAGGIMFYRSTDQSDMLQATPSPESTDKTMTTEGRSAPFQRQQPSSTPPATQEEEDGSPSRDSSAEDESQQSDEVTISINDQGFSPSTVTISPGTTVTFVNNGQAPHWPASDVHPTHEILPEFDSNRGLSTGETYSYTFTKAGTWAMHDHLNPRTTGVITVTE